MRTGIARFGASSPDAGVRLAAVRELLRSLDDATLELLRWRAAVETHPNVVFEIETAPSVEGLEDPDPRVRVGAPALRLPPMMAGTAERGVPCDLCPPSRWPRRSSPWRPRSRRRRTCRATPAASTASTSAMQHSPSPSHFIWGYCCILSLGPAACFALGGYTMGMCT